MCMIGKAVKVRHVKPSRPIIAVRFWDRGFDGEVHSVFRYGVVWPKGKPMQSPPPRLRDWPGDVLGFWAYKPKLVMRTQDFLGYTKGSTFRGKIKLWGKVVEHEDGYRAEFAQRVTR